MKPFAVFSVQHVFRLLVFTHVDVDMLIHVTYSS